MNRHPLLALLVLALTTAAPTLASARAGAPAIARPGLSRAGSSAAEARGLDMIPLIAPTTGHDRAARVLEGARGFVYYIMVRGVTGARGEVAADLADRVRDLRSVTSLPIAAGFGVSNGGQAREVARAADAVVVGSALVRAAGEGRLEALTKELKAGVEAAR